MCGHTIWMCICCYSCGGCWSRIRLHSHLFQSRSIQFFQSQRCTYLWYVEQPTLYSTWHLGANKEYASKNIYFTIKNHTLLSIRKCLVGARAEFYWQREWRWPGLNWWGLWSDLHTYLWPPALMKSSRYRWNLKLQRQRQRQRPQPQTDKQEQDQDANNNKAASSEYKVIAVSTKPKIIYTEIGYNDFLILFWL
jgi:hypothetical protein